MLRAFTDGHEMQVDFIRFPGGEQHVRVMTYDTKPDLLTITADLINSDAIMQLLMLTDALRQRYRGAPIKLVCPYFPYARQDRITEPGESLSVKVMSDLINSLNFTEVEIWDAHSDVTPALLNRCINMRHFRWVSKIARADHIIVSPDEGAFKKMKSLCGALKSATVCSGQLIPAGKKRDTHTGKITETVVYNDKLHYGEAHFLIVDDICDGGRTFVELAEKLRPLTNGNIHLYVTHGIFSRGLDVFADLIDHVFCANPWPGKTEGTHFKPGFTKVI